MFSFRLGFMYFSTGWTILCICIHGCFLHFRLIVFLQFNQLANCFDALESHHKSKIKRTVLITIPWNALPGWTGHLPCKKNSSLCLLPSFVWGAGRDEGYLGRPCESQKSLNILGVSCSYSGNRNMESRIRCALIYLELSGWFWQLCSCVSFPFRKAF